MYQPRFLTLDEANRLVNERTGTPRGRGPIWAALKEEELSAELWNGQQWEKKDGEWWNDPPINWLGAGATGGSILLGAPNATDVRVPRKDVDRLWPRTQDGSAGRLVEHKGRAKKTDWEGALIALARKVYVGDIDPSDASQSDLIRHMMEWFRDNQGAEPAESEAKKRARKFLNELKRE